MEESYVFDSIYTPCLKGQNYGDGEEIGGLEGRRRGGEKDDEAVAGRDSRRVPTVVEKLCVLIPMDANTWL